MSQVLGLVVVALLVAVSAYFVAMEFSFTAASRNRLMADAAAGDRKAAMSLAVLKRLSFCLSGAQLGITFAALLTGFVAEPVFAALFEPALAAVGVPAGGTGPTSLVLGFVVATFALMVLGELAPKNLAIAIPEQVARSLARSTLVFMRAGGPVIRLFDGAANRLLRRLGITPIQEAHGSVTSEDLAQIITAAGTGGHLSAAETELLGRALAFGELSAADVMVARPQVVTIGEDALGSELRALLRTSGHSRVPLVSGAAGTVVGVVTVKALLGVPAGTRDLAAVASLATAVLRVPETAALAKVVAQMRHQRTPFAVAVDETGSDVGILTLEDIVEVLVGEIHDERDPPTVPHQGDVELVSGGLNLHDLARSTGLELPDGDYDTLAGLVLSRLGRLAKVGDEVTVNGSRGRPAGGQNPHVVVTLRVDSLQGRRIGTVQVCVGRDGGS